MFYFSFVILKVFKIYIAAKSIYSSFKNFNLKYIFIDFTVPIQMLKYTIFKCFNVFIFSDTLDLLGGFEQADVGNSLLELFSMIQNNANSLASNLIQTDISASLK